MFEKAFNDLILKEGGYSNDSTDRGGETKYGITISVARQNGYKGPMEDLPLTLAKEIYKKNYWRKEFESFHWVIAEFLFDMNVNHGYKGMSLILQNSINLLTKNNIAEDGVAGKITYSTAAKLNQEKLFYMLFSYRCKYFVDIAKKDESQEKYVFGWTKNRVWLIFAKIILENSKNKIF